LKFSEFNKSSNPPVNPPVELGGSFTCQACDAEVDEAEWFRQERILRWKCPEGHISFIEDFSL